MGEGDAWVDRVGIGDARLTKTEPSRVGIDKAEPVTSSLNAF